MIKVYNQSMELVAYLENAFSIGYETPFNGLWTASFSLPANDEKNAECLPLRFVEFSDGNSRIDLFRITPSSAQRSRDGQAVTYSCEHVIATLLDDVLFQFHTVGNIGVYTADVIDYVLQQQDVQRWQLGSVNFDRQFEYSWENENLLSALYSIPKPFDSEYMWTWDTSSYPWTLNLVDPPAGVQAYIRYGVNMVGITKTVDPLDLCTRLYALGYGEGVNQLTISDVNGGVTYLDADTQGEYGVVSRIWTDRRHTSAETLKAMAQAILDQLKQPRISYKVDAADLSAITADPLDKFTAGSQVRVIDEELGIDVITRVVNVRKSDVIGQPGTVQLEIANRLIDIAGSIAELADRQRINDTYAQGATNWDSHDFADNCDPTHPAVLKFWVPVETTRINKVSLTFESEPFRAYSRSIEAAPAVSSGPSSISTTTSEPESVRTSHIESYKNYFAFEPIAFNGAHNHGIPQGTHLLTAGGGSVAWTPAANHGHDIYAHSHTIEIPAHSHEMPHTHIIPAHTHDIEHGIFEGPTPSSIGILVDGNLVPGSSTSADELDLLPYLSKDGEGKIQRGQWHTIEIVPNALGRVVATVITQIFVQSRGGGNY